MARVKRSVHARKKRRKVLEQAKGYYGRKKSSYRFAKEQVEHSLVYAYRDRKASGGAVLGQALDEVAAHLFGRGDAEALEEAVAGVAERVEALGEIGRAHV